MRTILGPALLLGMLFLSSEIADAHPKVTPWVRLAQTDQQPCQQWQVRDTNGNCADGPNAFHPAAGYIPAPNETCWAECECYNGAAPAADNCAPCTYAGQVCTR